MTSPPCASPVFPSKVGTEVMKGGSDRKDGKKTNTAKGPTRQKDQRGKRANMARTKVRGSVSRR